MLMERSAALTNEYAKDYYDHQVGSLDSYTDDRWHSSPIREFEYRQTERAFRKALGDRIYAKALEIGPGDGVWTAHTKQQVTGSLHLVEQSEEMLKRAKKRFAGMAGVTFERNDFQTSNPPHGNNLITAIRCFEYFDNKPAALEKMRGLLAPDGRIIIITKNPLLLTSQPAQGRTLHSGQVGKREMQRLAGEAGLTIERHYPAVLRWKAEIAPLRVVFDILHWISVTSMGFVPLPFFDPYAVESYTYVLRPTNQ